MRQTNLQQPTSPITKRAVLIGTVLIIGNSYWIAYVEMIWHTAHLTTVAMSVNVMFGIFVINDAEYVDTEFRTECCIITTGLDRCLQHACGRECFFWS